MSQAFMIRRATDQDALQLQHLFASIIRTAPWVPDDARQNTDFAALSQGETIDVCVDPLNPDTVRGFVSVWEPASFIHHLFVDPTHQRQGIGKALLASLDPWLAKPWRLKCTIANAPAHAFYLAQGWEVTDHGVSDHGPYHEMTLA